MSTDLQWTVGQLKHRHPSLVIETHDDLITLGDIQVQIPYEQLLDEVNQRQHFGSIEYDCDRLYTILLFVEKLAGLKSPYARD